MKTINKPLRTTIEHEGQSYVDEPVYVVVSQAKPLAYEMNLTFDARAGHAFAKPIEILLDGYLRAISQPRAPQVEPVIRDLSHYQHTRLNWISPPRAKGPRT